LSLEKHLEQVRSFHNLRLSKKTPAISDYIDLLKSNGIIGFPDARLIQSLAEIRTECLRNKKREPSPEEIGDMIYVADKVIMTIFNIL
jgi:hypothetical protein